MKKFFFFAAALMVSSAAMALEVYTPDQTAYPTEQEVKDKTAERTAVEAGAVLFTGTAFDVKNAFATTYQRVGLNANAYTTAKIGNQDVIVADQWGIQGNDNPKDGDGGNPALTLIAPTQGAAFQIDVKEDGFIYVLHKASSNKHYTVFEVYNGEATAMGYYFSMITCPAGKEALKSKTSWLEGIMCSNIINDSVITYSPVVDEDNYVTEAIVFPEIPNLKDEATYGHLADSASITKSGAYALNGLGVIAFPVEANTSYYVNACGSKMSLACIAFTANGAENVTVSNGTTTIELLEGKTIVDLPSPAAADFGKLVVEPYVSKGWGAQSKMAANADGAEFWYAEKLGWDIFNFNDQDTYVDASAANCVALQFYSTEAATLKVTIESEADTDPKTGVVVNVAEGWSDLVIPVADYAGVTFKYAKWFILEAYNDVAGNSMEKDGAKVAYANMGLYTKEAQAIENNAVVRANKALVNDQIVIVKNGVRFNLVGARF